MKKIHIELTPSPNTNKQDYSGGTDDKTCDSQTRESDDSWSDTDGVNSTLIFVSLMLLPTFGFLLWLYGSWVILFPVIEISESFFFLLLPRDTKKNILKKPCLLPMSGSVEVIVLTGYNL